MFGLGGLVLDTIVSAYIHFHLVPPIFLKQYGFLLRVPKKLQKLRTSYKLRRTSRKSLRKGFVVKSSSSSVVVVRQIVVEVHYPQMILVLPLYIYMYILINERMRVIIIIIIKTIG